MFIVVQNHKALLGNARIRCERVRDFRIAAPNVIGLRTRRTADDAFEAKSAIETLQALQRAAVREKVRTCGEPQARSTVRTFRER